MLKGALGSRTARVAVPADEANANLAGGTKDPQTEKGRPDRSERPFFRSRRGKAASSVLAGARPADSHYALTRTGADAAAP